MATTPTVKVIYRKPMLPDLARVLACLHEKKITFELEDMNKGVRMSQDMLNLQISSRRTPVLLDGSDEFFGSRKICRYIVEKYGDNGYQYLLGKDPLARVSVEQWIQSEEHTFDPPSSALVFYLAYKIESDVEKITKSEKKLEKVLNLYEQRLGESDFLAGKYFTLADLYHLPNTYYLESSVEYGYLFKDRKNVSRWWKDISERDSWKQVIRKFEEEGLQFNVPVSKSETDQSSPSPRKNGIKTGPVGGSEIGSKKQEAKAGIRENKGDANALALKKESTPGKEKKDNEAVPSKTEGKNDETKKVEESTAGKEKKDNEAVPSKTEGKNDETNKVEESTAGKEKKDNEAVQSKTEGKKVEESTPGKENKDNEAVQSKTEGKKEETPSANKKVEESTPATEKKDNVAVQSNTAGRKKDTPSTDKKVEESTPGTETKDNEAVQSKTEGKKDETPSADKKDEDKANKHPLSENEKGLPSNDKNTDQSEGGKKPVATDQIRGAINSDNQFKKGSESNDGRDKTSSGENKNPTPKDGKEEVN